MLLGLKIKLQAVRFKSSQERLRVGPLKSLDEGLTWSCMSLTD